MVYISLNFHGTTTAVPRMLSTENQRDSASLRIARQSYWYGSANINNNLDSYVLMNPTSQRHFLD